MNYKLYHWYKFLESGRIYVGQYIGRQRGFNCNVCGKGCNAHTFNIWHSNTDYETFSYGNEHLPLILEDLGESDIDPIICKI